MRTAIGHGYKTHDDILIDAQQILVPRVSDILLIWHEPIEPAVAVPDVFPGRSFNEHYNL